jgi:RNA polymerase sigma-70 factor (ECF subfamily)
MHPNPTDEQLMAAVRCDDRDAFAELVNRLSDQVYGLAYRMLGNEQDARDVSQDTFVNMWQSRRRWSPKGAVSTWAYRIATNLSLNRLRSRKRWRLLSLGKSNDEDNISIDLSIPDDEFPDAQLERSDVKNRLESAISKLPPRERAAILLRHQQGLSGKDVARILDTTIYGVDSLLFRARKRLRSILSEKK